MRTQDLFILLSDLSSSPQHPAAPYVIRTLGPHTQTWNECDLDLKHGLLWGLRLLSSHWGLTCCFVLQLGLLQALPVLYLDHVQIVTLLLQPGCLATLGTETARSCQHNPWLISYSDSRNMGPTGASRGTDLDLALGRT
jgi:hypothetical protein